jgi:hypothetical protein
LEVEEDQVRERVGRAVGERFIRVQIVDGVDSGWDTDQFMCQANRFKGTTEQDEIVVVVFRGQDDRGWFNLVTSEATESLSRVVVSGNSC